MATQLPRDPLAAPAYAIHEKDKNFAAEALFCYITAGEVLLASKMFDELTGKATDHGEWEYIDGLIEFAHEAQRFPFVPFLSFAERVKSRDFNLQPTFVRSKEELAQREYIEPVEKPFHLTEERGISENKLNEYIEPVKKPFHLEPRYLTTVRFLFRNLKGYRFLIVIAMAMTFVQVGADILIVFPLKFILDKIVNHSDPDFAFLGGLLNLFDQFGTTEGLHKGEVHTQLGVIVFSTTMLVVLGLLSAVLSYVELFLASYIGQNLTARLRKQLFGHLERLSLDWHGKQKKGDLVQRITSNIADIEKLVIDGLVDSLASIFILGGVIITMVLLNWQFTMLSIAIAPVLFVVILGYTKGIKSASKKTSKAAGQVAGVATEDIGAITALKAFRLEEREDLRFRDYVGRNQAAALRAGGLQAQFTSIVAILLIIGTAIIFGVGASVAGGNTFTFLFLTIPKGQLTVGTLTVFLAYFAKLYQPMRDLSKLTNLYTSAASGAERIQEVLNEAPEVLDPIGPYTGPEKFRGDISFENVYFSYMKDTAPVLKGIDLSIPAGRKIALVGLSGGGKTTLVKLIPRFYEIQQGAVKIDGYDNRTIPLAILRQNVSHVLQESVLFEGTIRENIALGRPGANFSEIVDAAKKANIHETIALLPDGYDNS
jgi:ATP-binding cassette subfamily B protein